MAVFKKYAKYYDTFYRDKDYKSESKFLARVFSKYSKKKITSVLDLGCGTGNHDFVLEKMGYELTGVDFSSEMLSIAKRKAKSLKSKSSFFLGDITKVRLKRNFDAVISMFAVMSYLETNDDIASAIKTASAHLNKGGIFVFDFWFGPGVLAQKPSKRKKIFGARGEKKITRTANSTLNLLSQTVKIKLSVSGHSPKNRSDEIHKMRFLFPKEIEYYLTENGFSVEKISRVDKLSEKPTDNDWVAFLVAKKI